MPFYDYTCAACGDFRLLRPMSECRAAAACPTCGEPAVRLVTAPFLADMNPHTRVAHARNERSAHEPRVMHHAQLEGHALHSHPHAHAHGDHGHKHSEWVQSSRPWMIGH